MSEIHPILSDDGFDDAVEYVPGYFHRASDATGRKWWTGAYFDTWAGGGNGATANELTSDGFVAVSMLSVDVPGQAVAGLQDRAFEVLSLSKLEAAVLAWQDYREPSGAHKEAYRGGSGARSLSYNRKRVGRRF